MVERTDEDRAKRREYQREYRVKNRVRIRKQQLERRKQQREKRGMNPSQEGLRTRPTERMLWGLSGGRFITREMWPYYHDDEYVSHKEKKGGHLPWDDRFPDIKILSFYDMKAKGKSIYNREENE